MAKAAACLGRQEDELRHVEVHGAALGVLMQGVGDGPHLPSHDVLQMFTLEGQAFSGQTEFNIFCTATAQRLKIICPLAPVKSIDDVQAGMHGPLQMQSSGNFNPTPWKIVSRQPEQPASGCESSGL